MSYAMSRSRARSGMGTIEIVMGIPVPVASGSGPYDASQDMPNVFGDYESHPLVKYMRAVMPAAFGGPPSTAFGDQVKLAMLAMQYQGQPVELIKVAARSAAAANADTFTASVDDPGVKASLFNSNAEITYQNLIPIAEAVAAMPKPFAQIQLNLGAVGAKIVACVKGGGKWTSTGCAMPPIQLNLGAVGAQIVACVKANGTWKNNTCTTTRAGVRWDATQRAFVPIAAPAPPPPTSHTGLYIGIGAAVVALGAVAFLKLRAPARA